MSAARSRPTTAAPVVRLAGLRENALDVTEVLRSLADPAAGGVDVFVGVVRDHDHDRGVVALEYTAHPTAAARLSEVLDRVAHTHDVVAVAALHRLGRLEVGDVAVVVAAAAVHRKEAFDATRALIDDLKSTVPIWKHQLFGDGSQEWVGTP